MKFRNGLSDEQRSELVRRLNEIPGVKLSMDVIDRHPSILISTLANANALDQFLHAIAWTNEQVKASTQ
jgi:hypothetical protein